MEERRKENQLNSERLIRVEMTLVDHQRQDDEHFVRLSRQIDSNKEEILASVDSLRATVQELWDNKTRQEGAVAAGRYVGHAATILISGAFAFIVTWLKTGGRTP